MIKKLTKTIVVGTLVMSLWIVNVFANSYKGYVLPARQGNNYTGAHSKTTTSNYITNKVTDVENAGTVTFWAANKDEKQISSDYDQKLNSKVNINFNKNGYNRKNKQIKLGMENKKWTFNQRGFVSGEVDFR